MSLAAGARLGPYEVLGLIGAGGMGEVYRARDTRLDRTVALKILPAELSADPERRTRFEREAHTVSGLSHPHICTLHDVGDHDGVPYLVMEHLAGETLAARLLKGPLPLDQGLEIGAQVAEALDAAHKAGVVHRDLKPANVMLTSTGATRAGAPHVKLLDFGLAKLRGHGERPAVVAEASAATDAASLTGRGTILGTLSYMAPEQLEGQAADARTDLWALGAMLYEMVTGRRAFEGASSVSLISAIMQAEPPAITTLQPLTPPALERVVRKCLAKAPDDRWDSAHDVADELRWIAGVTAGATAVAASAPGLAGPAHRPWGVAAVALALLLGLSLGVVLGRSLLGRREPLPVVRSLLSIAPADEVNATGVIPGWIPTPGGSRTALAWTPDGRRLVFVGRRGGTRQLYVRALGEDTARPIDGTDDAQVPAISPSGQWVAFWAKRALRRTALNGGPATVLADRVTVPPTGMAWADDSRVFYADRDVIWSVEPEREPAQVTKKLQGELLHSLPHLLPGGRVLVFTVRTRRRTWGDEAVVAQVLATGERKLLLQEAADARYVDSGHLVFLRRGTLFAVGFDAARLEVQGTPVPVLGTVAQALTGGNSADHTGAGQFAVASTGMLAYLPGPAEPYIYQFSIVAVDRQGRATRLGAPIRSYAPHLAVSRDGRRLAVATRDIAESPIWVYDTERWTGTKIGGGGEQAIPRWTPDEQRVAFNWVIRGSSCLAWQAADGSGAPEVLAEDVSNPSSWSPDGRQLAFVRNRDIWIASVKDGTASVEPLAQTDEDEAWPEFSPDGRWLAYASNASGRMEVYVQPYPGPGARRQVSLDGGFEPAWSPTGRELFFGSILDDQRRGQMMAVDVRFEPSLSLGRPHPLFTASDPPFSFAGSLVRPFDVSADGRLFYVTQFEPGPPIPPVAQIHVILNWLEELKAKVPTGR